MAESKLTNKQAAFVREYLIDLNATQAAIRAGYSKKTANEQGCQNLVKLNIAEAIAEAQEKRAKKQGIDAEWVLKESVELYEIFKAEKNPAANSTLTLIAKHVNVDAMASDKSRLVDKDGKDRDAIQVIERVVKVKDAD